MLMYSRNHNIVKQLSSNLKKGEKKRISRNQGNKIVQNSIYNNLIYYRQLCK